MYAHLARSVHYTKPFGQLHVIVPIFNPMRFLSRYTLFKEFVKRAEADGAEVWIVELGYGARPYEVTEEDNPHHIQLRSDQEVWHKEAMINIGIANLPHDWEYCAWIDGDVLFVNPNWVQETIHQLQHFCIVQMFHSAHDLDANGGIMNNFDGFPASVVANGGTLPFKDYYYPYGIKGKFHPGYAWAIRREAWNTIGGLIDFNIVGGGDHQMSFGLYGEIDKAIPFQSTFTYRHLLHSWQNNALKLNKNIGFVPGTLLHFWHGKKVDRGYFDRWKILAENEFDPIADLKRDWHGLWMLNGDKPKLRDDLIEYFRSRQEDALD
jgi:hypothetical protein